jgi:hypothetical protein
LPAIGTGTGASSSSEPARRRQPNRELRLRRLDAEAREVAFRELLGEPDQSELVRIRSAAIQRALDTMKPVKPRPAAWIFALVPTRPAKSASLSEPQPARPSATSCRRPRILVIPRARARAPRRRLPARTSSGSSDDGSDGPGPSDAPEDVGGPLRRGSLSAADLREQVLTVVRELGPVSTTKVRAAVRARAQRTSEALTALGRAGKVRSTPHGWQAVHDPVPCTGQGSPATNSPPAGLTAATLDAMPRPARVVAIWGALSPAGRERAWAALSDAQRVEAVAVLFDAVEAEPAEPFAFTAGGGRQGQAVER